MPLYERDNLLTRAHTTRGWLSHFSAVAVKSICTKVGFRQTNCFPYHTKK